MHGLTSDTNHTTVQKHLLDRGFTLKIPSTLPPKYIPNTNIAYKEYLNNNNLTAYPSLKLNRGTVREHLLELGFMLTDKKSES